MNKRQAPLKILITAGATREPIDPVRFVSNYATGFFGLEIARAARRRGHRVLVVMGASAVGKAAQRSAGFTTLIVETAREMRGLLRKHFSWCDCLIMNAAVCDFRPRAQLKRKIKSAGKKIIQLELEKNPDLLAECGRKKGLRLVVGFALETEQLERRAREKLRQKNLDIIVATQIRNKSHPFGKVKISPLIMDKNDCQLKLAPVSKARLSRILLDKIESMVYR
ncbi:MAG: phosphopantothenoylcysteine decarboxylase [Candidatus Omnitrophota bacterium]